MRNVEQFVGSSERWLAAWKNKWRNPDKRRSKLAARCNREQVYKRGRVYNFRAVIWILWWDDVWWFSVYKQHGELTGKPHNDKKRQSYIFIIDIIDLGEVFFP